MSTKKKFFIWCLVAGFLCCLLIGFFVQSLVTNSQEKDPNDHLRFFGLLSDEVVGQLPVILKSDVEMEYEGRPEFTLSIADQVPVMVDRYLSAGDFESLEKYLRGLEDTYQNAKNIPLTTEEIHNMRADLTLFENMNAYNAPVTMKGFHSSKFLAASMIYAPLSCKYQTMHNSDSLMIPPPKDGTQTNLKEKELTQEELSSWLVTMNTSKSVPYVGVKIYTCKLYGADVELVTGLNMDTGVWQPYLIRSDDERTEKVFQTARKVQKMVDDGFITEENMDTIFYYDDINNIDMSVYEQ